MSSSKQHIPLTADDYGTLFEFTDTRTDESFGITLATVLQCLCIAEQRFLVPPLDKKWEALTIPSVIRDRGKVDVPVPESTSN